MRTYLAGLVFLFIIPGSFAQSVKNNTHYSVQKRSPAARALWYRRIRSPAWRGLQILKQGGNAGRRAIATQLALAVVYPAAGNIGGADLWWHTSAMARIYPSITAKSPGKASRDTCTIDKARQCPNWIFAIRSPGLGVPGTVAGLFAA